MTTALAPSIPLPGRPVDSDRPIGAHLLTVSLLIGILTFGVGGWAIYTRIHGAVVALGQLVVESDVKKVQHPTGGVVGEIRGAGRSSARRRSRPSIS